MNSFQRDLERIYDRWGAALFTCALSVTGCRDLAEDALHEAFTRLLRTERAPQNPKAYVFQCVRNAAIDLIRKNQNVRIKDDKIEVPSYPYWEKKESAIHLIAAPQILVFEHSFRAIPDNSQVPGRFLKRPSQPFTQASESGIFLIFGSWISGLQACTNSRSRMVHLERERGRRYQARPVPAALLLALAGVCEINRSREYIRIRIRNRPYSVVTPAA